MADVAIPKITLGARLGAFRMSVHMNREIKAFCPDFVPVRRILRESGASFIETKRQLDCYYRLPDLESEAGTRRFKLRSENEKTELIYYRDHHETGTRISEFQLWQMPNREILEVLDAVLGVRVVVRKKRELWHLDNIKFNLDCVEGVGQIFELEAQQMDGRDIVGQVEEYRSRLSPYLGAYITCSNENLVESGPSSSMTAP